MRIRATAVGFALALVWTSAAQAQPWRYTDSKGRVHWTNDINQLPPKLRKRVLAKRARKKPQRPLLTPPAAAPEPAPAPARSGEKPTERPGFAPAELSRGVFAEPKAKPKPKAPPLAVTPTVDWNARVADASAKAEAARARVAAAEKELQAAVFLLSTVPSGPAFARRNKALAEEKAAMVALRQAETNLVKTKADAQRARR